MLLERGADANAVSGKVTAFLGPAVFSLATDLGGSQRIGMASTLPFFILGLVLLVGKVGACPDADAPR